MNILEDDNYYNRLFDDDDGATSQYSIAGFPLPPLGGLAPRKHKLRRLIISPNNPRYRYVSIYHIRLYVRYLISCYFFRM